ncbi:MAG: Na/Pi symporter [Paenibacillaceae bacterium]
MFLFITELMVPLIVGLTLFLFGMKIVEWALYQWTGHILQKLLQRLTQTPLRGLLIGTGTTALLQSSSAVTVITIGFVNAGLLTFPQTLGIILGTNIGSCLTTELIGLRLSGNMITILLTASIFWFLTWLPQSPQESRMKKVIESIRGMALTIAGFSCVLLGLEVMQSIIPYLQEHGLLAWFIEHAQQSLLWGIIAGAALTAIIHSSAASIAITMGLATLNIIPIDLGIAIILGCNIGTCMTPLLASIGGNRFGYYVAWSHILLNVGGALLFYPFISQLSSLSSVLSAKPDIQLAHIQTFFNVSCSLIALPICYLPVLRRIQ